MDTEEKTAQEYVAEGNAYNAKGEYDKAIDNYTKAIGIDPNFAGAYLNRGSAYANKGEYNTAIDDYTEALKINSKYVEAYFNRGNTYANKGEYDKAIGDYTKAIEINPDFIKAHVNRGNAYNAKGEYDTAIDDFTKAIKINPDFAEAYFNRGNAYNAKGEYDKAIDNFTKAIELNPKYADAYNNRGIAYNAKGEYDTAIDDFNKAIELNPTDAEAYNNRGNSYLKKGEYDNAINDCSKAIKLNPDFFKVHFNRGITYDSKGEYDKAIDDYTKAIKINPTYADTYNNRGVDYAINGEYNTAIDDFDKAIELNQDFAMAYHNRGSAYAYKSEYDKAIDDLSKALEINPDFFEAYNNRGLTYGNKGEHHKAIDNFNTAIKLNPKYAMAYNNRGYTYYNRGKYNKAIDDFNEALKINPKYATAYVNRGIAYAYKGDYDKAIDDFAHAYNLGDKTITMYFFISMFIEEMDLTIIFDCLTKINEIWENDPVYRNIIAEHPDSVNDTNRENTKKLWFYQYVLLYILSLKDDKDNIAIAHYTSTDTLKTLLNANAKSESSKFRLTSITEANDIEEGNILLKLLEQNKATIECNKEDIHTNYKLTALQASFTRKKDSLTMFRLYGKNAEKKEATGACIVFEKSFFKTGKDTFMSPMSYASNIEKTLQPKTKDENTKKLPLYYVLYYDKEDNTLVYNPSHNKYDNTVISLNDITEKAWKKPPNNNDNDITVNNIQFLFNEISGLINSINNDNENCTLIYMLLINLHYLIKHIAFIEEAELRLLEIVQNHDGLKDYFTINKSCKNYFPLIDTTSCYIKEIILGNKSENAKWLKESLKRLFENDPYKKCGDIKVTVSELPLR